MQDVGDELPIVVPLWPRLVLGQERFHDRPLLVRKPEQVRHRRLRAGKAAALNYKITALATPWFGSHPRDSAYNEVQMEASWPKTSSRRRAESDVTGSLPMMIELTGFGARPTMSARGTHLEAFLGRSPGGETAGTPSIRRQRR